jgi:hypothetical protein
MRLMIGRLQTNAREYPRFTALVASIYGGAAVLAAIAALACSNSLRSVLQWAGVAILAVLALDILTYIWVVADAGRTDRFVELVDDFEGKRNGDECPDCGSDECQCPPEEEEEYNDEDRSL